MTSPLDTLLVRGAPPAAPPTPYSPGRAPRRVLVLAVQADEADRPTGAAVVELLDGVPVEALVGIAGDAGREEVADRDLGDVSVQVVDLGAVGRRVAKRCGGAGVGLVGAGLPWALGRLAAYAGSPRTGGVALSLVGSGVYSDVGRWRESWHAGFRLVIETRAGDDVGAFFAWRPPRRPKGGGTRARRRWRGGGPVIDLRTVGGALGADPASARTLAASYGIIWPETADPVDRLLAEAAVLVELWRKMTVELAEVAPGLAPQRTFSAGSLVSHALHRAGVAPPASSTATLSPAVLGRCSSAFFGGRIEASLVGVLVPMVLVDLTATYPSAFSLLDLTAHLAAERFTEEAVEPAEVEALLAPDGLRGRLDERDFWQRIGTLFAEVEPHGERLPSTRRVGADTRTISAPLELHGDRAWRHAADLVLPALGGRLPRIHRAFRVVPVGVAPGLRPVRLPSGAEIDLAAEGADWGRALILEREAARAVADPLEHERFEFRAKGVAVAGAWGLFARVDRRRLREVGENVLVGPDGAEHRQAARRVDKAGPLTLWHLASAVPAACRAILAMVEHDVEVLGGSVATALTDAVAVPCAPGGGLVPCPAGPHRTPGGEDAVRCLDPTELAAVLERFDPLLQPWGGRAWKVEADSGDGRTVGLVAGLNKLLLAHEEDGRVRLVRSSDTGLGEHLLDPTGTGGQLEDGRRAWSAALEERLVAHLAAGGAYRLPRELFGWTAQPALRAERPGTMEDLRRLRADLGDRAVMPFARLVRAGDGAPVALVHDQDPSGWRGWSWRKDGAPCRVGVLGPDGEIDASAGTGPVHVVPAIRDILRGWLAEHDVTMDRHGPGLRRLVPVRSTAALTHLVGRGGLLAGAVAEEGPADLGPLVPAEEVVAQARRLGAAEIARRSGLPDRSVRRVLAGTVAPSPETLTRIVLALSGGVEERRCAAGPLCRHAEGGRGRLLRPRQRRWCSDACQHVVARQAAGIPVRARRIIERAPVRTTAVASVEEDELPPLIDFDLSSFAGSPWCATCRRVFLGRVPTVCDQCGNAVRALEGVR